MQSTKLLLTCLALLCGGLIQMTHPFRALAATPEPVHALNSAATLAEPRPALFLPILPADNTTSPGEPVPHEPVPTEPEPTEPEPTEPEPTEPEPTEPHEEEAHVPFDGGLLGLPRQVFAAELRAASHVYDPLGDNLQPFAEAGDYSMLTLQQMLDEVHPAPSAHIAATVGGLPPVVPVPVATEFTRDGIQVVGEGTNYVTEDGRRVGMETGATLDRNGVQLTQGQGWLYNFAPCPTAMGEVPGMAWHTHHISTRTTAANTTDERSIDVRTEATVTGYTGRNGRLENYDLDVITTLHIRNTTFDTATGSRLSHDPRSFRSRTTLSRVPIQATAQDLQQAQVSIWGPRGRVSTLDYLLNREPMQTLTRAFAAMQSGIENEWIRAERNWYDEENCLKVVFDPTTLALQPGAQLSVDVGLGMQDGSTAGETDLTLRMANGGSVTPAAGAASGIQPLATRVTAPNRRWTTSPPTLMVEAVGYQGKARGALAAPPNEDTLYIRLHGAPDDVFVAENPGTRIIFDDPRAVSIKLENPYAGSGARVEARIRLAGSESWQTRDWSNEPLVNFCRDFEAERVAELVVEVTPAHPDMPLPVHPMHITATNIGCAYWEGWVESEWITSPQGELRSIYSANVMFERMEGQQDATSDLLYRLIIGEVTWQLDGVFYECTAEGGPLNYNSEGQWSGDLQLNNFGAAGDASPTGYRAYTGMANLHVQSPYTIHCPGASVPNDWLHGAFWATDDAQTWQVSSDGSKLSGEYTKRQASNMRHTVRWEFNSFPE